MKNLKINFLEDFKAKYVMPEAPKAIKCYFKSFFPKTKLITRFPDINKNSGYGHFFRVIKYSYYLRGKFFLILKTKISKKLINQLKSKKIKFILLKDLKTIKYSNSYLVIDSYSNIPKILKRISFKKTFLISDKKPIKMIQML